MTSRFDNLSAEELQARVAEAHREFRDLHGALVDRLKAEALTRLTLGRCYQVAQDGRHLAGRIILLWGVKVDGGPIWALDRHDRPFYAVAWGWTNTPGSSAGDGWSIKPGEVRADRLLTPEVPPPRGAILREYPMAKGR